MATKGKQLPVKEEQAERETLIKALEENLKAVVENEEEPADLLEEDEEESRPEDEQEEDDDMDEDFIEQPIKKEPKSFKTVKHSSHRNEPQGPQPASYIMKLFDRSVNLAQFEEDTPLYPLCRAWMKNQPRTQIIRPDKTVSDDPLDNIQEAQDGDVVEMPKVRIRKGKNPARSEVRINKKDFDKQIDVEVWTKEKLLDEHRVHWQSEKERHIKNSRMFEEKHFAANLELIESLIKESEE